MKGKLTLLSALVMRSVLMLSAAAASASSESDPEIFARFTATGNGPYGTLPFSKNGKNTSIDPDTVTRAAIRCRTEAQFDDTGAEYTGQFYISPAAEPCIPIKYNFTKNRETVVVDLTSASDGTDLVSKWDSSSCTARNTIRFDPNYTEPPAKVPATAAPAGEPAPVPAHAPATAASAVIIVSLKKKTKK